MWAFGCVFYEMLSGRRPFEGDDVSDTLAFIITKDPDWSALPSEAPPAIRRLLRRCLSKHPRERIPDTPSDNSAPSNWAAHDERPMAAGAVDAQTRPTAPCKTR